MSICSLTCEFKVFYTNSDQLLNKHDDLLMQIADISPDIILITEVIPKAQINPIDEARLNIPGFNVFLNFDPTLHNLGSSNCCGIAIYVSNTINATELLLDTEFKELSQHKWSGHKWSGGTIYDNINGPGDHL